MHESEGYLDFDEINEESIYYKVPSFNSREEEECSERHEVNVSSKEDEKNRLFNTKQRRITSLF